MTITKSNHMRQLLRESDWTVRELAWAAGAQISQAHRLVKQEVKSGNVGAIGQRDVMHQGYRAAIAKTYTWCGDDDLITVAKRAASYLRDSAQDPTGQALSRHLFRLSATNPIITIACT